MHLNLTKCLCPLLNPPASPKGFVHDWFAFRSIGLSICGYEGAHEHMRESVRKHDIYYRLKS